MRKALAACFTLMLVLVIGGRRFLSSADSGRDLVPDEATAVRIAEAVLIPKYGEEQVAAQRPYRASTQDKEYWLVSGSAPKGQLGKAFAVWIRKRTGCIINVSHTK